MSNLFIPWNAHLRIAGNAALCGTRKLLNTPAVGTTVKCAKTKICFGIKRFYLFVSQLLLFCGLNQVIKCH